MNTMDVSQISELATAIMDSWTSASGELIGNSQSLGVQSPEQINKFVAATIKQEPQSSPGEFPGVIPIQNYVPGHLMSPTSPEQVPMDDIDPLESYAFWDGEHFYFQQDYDACVASNCEMQSDSNVMPTLPEYMGDDDVIQDDVFQIKASDLLHNPTLAELNSCNENLFDYSVDTSFMAEDNSFPMIADNLSRTFPSTESQFVTSMNSNIPNSSPFTSNVNYVPTGYIEIKQNIQPSLSSSCPVPSRFMPNSQYLNTCDEKFLMCPQNSPASDYFFSQRVDSSDSKSHISLSSCSSIPSPIHVAQTRLQENNLLSSSAPPDVTMASYFPKVKIEPPSHSPGPRSVTERSLSGFSSLSLSNDDESGSHFDDTDHDEEDEFSSEEDVYESSETLSTSWPSVKDEKSCQHRKHRYFWQYNLQSRGAKTQDILPRKILSRKDATDPYVLNVAFDPVFSEEYARPVKHSGKARRGDGNDLTPNPCKLFNIGIELRKLNKLIFNINPQEPGVQGKEKNKRKEKNKLASRVCRLKKKAQHEANKIKLYGLQKEHEKLLPLVLETKKRLRYKIENFHDVTLSNWSKTLDNYIAANEPYKVAGNTAAFVNEVLDKVAIGEYDGGLEQL